MKNGAIESDWITMKVDGKFGVTTPLHSACRLIVSSFFAFLLFLLPIPRPDFSFVSISQIGNSGCLNRQPNPVFFFI